MAGRSSLHSVKTFYLRIVPGIGRIPTWEKLAISSGWWYTYPSEKYEFVNWDDGNSQYMEKKMFQTSHGFLSMFFEAARIAPNRMKSIACSQDGATKWTEAMSTLFYVYDVGITIS